jgi:NADH-quinone oxidoreductase subunit M
MHEVPVLTLLTLVPLGGGLVVVGIPPAHARWARGIALACGLVSLVLALAIATASPPAAAGLQWVERYPWIPALHVDYFVGVDGLGLLMVLLTAVLVPLAQLASRHIAERVSLYHALVLWLETGLFGTFTALNFIHWFLFWELSLIPAFFLIRLWGGPRRTTAAVQFLLYALVGSVAMLLSFLALGLAVGSFDLVRLAELGQGGRLAPALAAQLGWPGLGAEGWGLLVFLGVFLGLAVKVPLMPFHTWLPLAYAEAPTPVTMLLTGLMSKMGVYGFLRIALPLFPDQMRQVLALLLGLAVVTVVVAAAVAAAQTDLKRLLAYSSINHLGYCFLGILAAATAAAPRPGLEIEKAAALNGVCLQMFNHGLTAATLFALVGFLEQRTGGPRGLDDFGGLRRVVPVFGGLMGVSVFSSLGLPGLNGFVGEFLIFKGAFPLAPWAAGLSVLGLLLTAIFLLTFLQRVFHGPLNPRWAGLRDVTWGEGLSVGPAVGLMFLLGVHPQLLIALFNGTVARLVEQLKL